MFYGVNSYIFSHHPGTPDVMNDNDRTDTGHRRKRYVAYTVTALGPAVIVAYNRPSFALAPFEVKARAEDEHATLK